MTSNLLSTIVLTTFLFIVPTLQAQTWSENWTLDEVREGISLYSQKIPGRKVFAFRATGIIDAPLTNVLATLRTIETYAEWSQNLKHIETIKDISDLSAITYEVHNLPWPAEDRDMTIEYILSAGTKPNSLLVSFHSVNIPSHPKTEKYVRAQLERGEMEFTLRGDKTHLDLKILADPKGVIPKIIVNYVQASMPYEYLRSLNERVSRVKMKLRPGIRQLVNRIFPSLKVSLSH